MQGMQQILTPVLFLLVYCLQAGSGHTFAESAILEKSIVQALELPVQQKICLVNQADSYVGHG